MADLTDALGFEIRAAITTRNGTETDASESITINRWTRGRRDRLYVNGLDSDAYVDLVEETVVADDGLSADDLVRDDDVLVVRITESDRAHQIEIAVDEPEPLPEGATKATAREDISEGDRIWVTGEIHTVKSFPEFGFHAYVEGQDAGISLNEEIYVLDDEEPEPRDVDFDETTSAVTKQERHECEHCGDEFDSSHGLAIHQGMVHSDDDMDGDKSDASNPEESNDGECANCGESPTTECLASGKPICQSCAESGVKILADGGRDRIPPEEFLELAHEYRDALLRDLGVVGVKRASHGSYPGDLVRELPVQKPGMSSNVSHRPSLPGSRQLRDVRDYEGESDLASSADVDWLTVRETSGPGAIFSSGTLTLGWSDPPTPREVRLAEYLEGLEDEQIAPGVQQSAGVDRDAVRQALIENMFTVLDEERRELLWVDHDDAPVDNMEALTECVGGIKIQHAVSHNAGERRERIAIPRVEVETDRDDAPSTRIAFGSSLGHVAMEHYYGYRERSEHLFVGDRDLGSSDPHDWTELNASISAVGIARDIHRVRVADDELVSQYTGEIPSIKMDATVATIPEFAPPEDVLEGVERQPPETPFSDGLEPEDVPYHKLGVPWEVRAEQLESNGVPTRRAQIVALLEDGGTNTEIVEEIDEINAKSNVSTAKSDYQDQFEESEWIAGFGPDPDAL